MCKGSIYYKNNNLDYNKVYKENDYPYGYGKKSNNGLAGFTVALENWDENGILGNKIPTGFMEWIMPVVTSPETTTETTPSTGTTPSTETTPSVETTNGATVTSDFVGTVINSLAELVQNRIKKREELYNNGIGYYQCVGSYGEYTDEIKKNCSNKEYSKVNIEKCNTKNYCPQNTPYCFNYKGDKQHGLCIPSKPDWLTSKTAESVITSSVINDASITSSELNQNFSKYTNEEGIIVYTNIDTGSKYELNEQLNTLNNVSDTNDIIKIIS